MSRKTLHQLYAEHQGKVSDKWSLYLTEYDHLFDGYRDKPVRLLEIGIQNGGSLDIWSKYFSNASVLIGCDINPDCARLIYDDQRIGVIVGDANAPEVREQVFQRSPQFDIIIDDGSHLSSEIIKSFALYFPLISEGGAFIAEDLHCSYWGQYEGGLFDPYSSIAFFKRLADVINHEHWGVAKTRADVLRGIFTKYDCEFDVEALSQVHSVEFINSMCVVRKAPVADNRLGRRIIAGSMELVVPGLHALNNRPYQLEPGLDQSSNPWTARATPPDEAIQHTEVALANAQQQIAGLSQAVTERDGQIANLSQAVTERDGQIANLSQAVTERDGQIASLSQAVQERDSRIERINSSTSMRLTMPLRELKKIYHVNKAVMQFPVRAVWRSLPIGIERKTKIRSALNRYFPTLERRLRTEAELAIAQPQSLVSQRDAIYLKEYRQRFAMAVNDISDFVPLAGEDINAERVTVKVIAFYLPQFHPIPENDKNWGRGFTEWTNVSKAMPQFVGHYQPRLPGELGFYDLRLKEIQKRQIELARQYGIHGFCYHHYWFGGKRVLEKPFEQVLNDPTLDLPFCLCWANENWTRRWDGGEDDIILAQNHSPEDDLLFFEDILRALKDSRYIRIDGKPLLIVYRPGLLPDAGATAQRWRQAALEAGLPGLYLASAATFGFEDYAKIGFDGLVQFPPNNIRASDITGRQTFLNPQFSGHVYDYEKFSDKAVKSLSDKQHVFPCVMMAWDNEARKPGKGHIFAGCNPERYKKWLRHCFDFVLCNNIESERLVFVNAWNEWAEGTYLEPDRRYGYAYLHATSNVVREYYRDDNITALIERNNARFEKTSDTIVVLHLYYFDILEEMLDRFREIQNADFLITLPPHSPESVINRLINSLPSVYLLISNNKGRDILPFIKAFPIVLSFGYNFLLKIHTKKSTHRQDGLKLRQSAFSSLLSSPSIGAVRSYFEGHRSIGLIGPSGSILSLADDAYLVNNRFHLEHCLRRIGFANEPLNFDFVAGSMFWARVDALKLLCDLSLSEDDFEEELGQLDGTMAHAIERIFGFLALKAGYSMRSINQLSEKHAW